MDSQVLSSPVWQTVGVLILIIATAIAIITSIQKGPKSSRVKKVLYIVTVSLTVLLIAGTSEVIHVLSPTSQILLPSPTSSASRLSPTPTPNSPSLTPSPTPTSAPPSGYSAAHPAPGCDTGRGTWYAQGVNSISCTVWLSNITTETWGYLSLQLPDNAAFAANNEISVTLSYMDSLSSECFGLAEQNANTGYLVAYCVNGAWAIDLLSQQGTVIRTISHNFTAARSQTTFSLTLVKGTLKFAIDAETHQIPISPFQPSKVAIAFYDNGCGSCSAQTTNFNYITPAS